MQLLPTVGSPHLGQGWSSDWVYSLWSIGLRVSNDDSMLNLAPGVLDSRPSIRSLYWFLRASCQYGHTPSQNSIPETSAYSRVSFSGIVLRGMNLGTSPGCTLSWGPILASLSKSPLTKFIITDWAMSSRLWPVARYVAPILLASSFISLLRNTPQ